MSSHALFSPLPRRACGLAAVLACLCSPALAAGFDTQAQVTGTLRYPDMVPGNTGSASFITPTSPVTGPKSASATETRSGTDANSVTGTTTFSGSIAASGGMLQGSGSSQVVAGTIAPYLLQGYFPHGEALVNATASWVDSITLYDTSLALGAPLAVDLFLHISSSVAYGSSGGADYNHGGTTQVFTGFGLDGGGGSVSAYSITNANGLNGYVQNDQRVTLNFSNGASVAFTANLQVYAEAALGSSGTGAMASSTAVDASVLTTISRSGGLKPQGLGANSATDASTFTAIGASGHNYLPSAVPEPGSAWLMGLGGLATATLAGLRRRRCSATAP